MVTHPLDDPLTISNLFYPRSAQSGTSCVPGAIDGTIPVEDGIVLTYRFYIHCAESLVILYFHGNNEIVTDYDGIAQLFFDIGVSLLVVDYHCYGWSTSTPLTSKLLSSAETVATAQPSVFDASAIGCLVGTEAGSCSSAREPVARSI